MPPEPAFGGKGVGCSVGTAGRNDGTAGRRGIRVGVTVDIVYSNSARRLDTGLYLLAFGDKGC